MYRRPRREVRRASDLLAEHAAQPPEKLSAIGLRRASAAAPAPAAVAAAAARDSQRSAGASDAPPTPGGTRGVSSAAGGSTAAGSRRSSLMARRELLDWVRELELEPAVTRAFERALRVHHRRGSASQATGSISGGSHTGSGLSSGRSSAESEDDYTGKRVPCRVRLRRLRRALREAAHGGAVRLYPYVRPLIVARHLFSIYALCLGVAALSVFIPEALLELNNDDNVIWAAIAWEAAVFDTFLVQPLLIALQLACAARTGATPRRGDSPEGSAPSGTPAKRRARSPESQRASLFLTADAVLAPAPASATSKPRRPSMSIDKTGDDPKLHDIRNFLQRSLSPEAIRSGSPGTVTC